MQRLVVPAQFASLEERVIAKNVAGQMAVQKALPRKITSHAKGSLGERGVRLLYQAENGDAASRGASTVEIHDMDNSTVYQGDRIGKAV